MDTKRERLEKLKTALINDRRAYWDPHYRELAEYILPRRARFLTIDHNRGYKVNQKIINSTATLAARTQRAGMMSGITSPARPWFRLSTPDPGLTERAAVKQWLDIVSTRMREVFLRSNFYNALPHIYGDLGVFGTAAAIMVEDFKDVLRCYTFPIGSYVLANNDRMVVDTLIRDYKLTVRQLVTRYGEYDPRTGKAQWDNFSTTVKNAWDRGDYEQTVDVTHAIGPNFYYEPGRAHAKFKPFMSCHYETGNADKKRGGEDIFLKESGFDESPILAPRWETTGEDTYGGSCPGMDALGDVKGLQTIERTKGQGLEKQIKPPMNAPTSMRNQKASIIAGDINYFDAREGQQGFRPVYETRLALNEVNDTLARHEDRIRRAFYEDLFLMLSQSDRREITAREVEERHEEKLLALGPVLERLNDELLDPAIDRAFAIMVRFNMIPPAPPELQKVPLKIEYVSIMAAAQKLVGLVALERFVSFTTNLAQFKPDVLDKLDSDQTLDEYADITGVSPKIVVPDDQVAQIRAARAQAQQKQQALANAQAGANTAKAMSQANLEGNNALTRILEQASTNAGAVQSGAPV